MKQSKKLHVSRVHSAFVWKKTLAQLNNDKELAGKTIKSFMVLLQETLQEVQQAQKKYTKIIELHKQFKQLKEAMVYIQAPHLQKVLVIVQQFGLNKIPTWLLEEIEDEIQILLQAIASYKLD